MACQCGGRIVQVFAEVSEVNDEVGKHIDSEVKEGDFVDVTFCEKCGQAQGRVSVSTPS